MLGSPPPSVHLSVIIACLDAARTLDVQLAALAGQGSSLPPGTGWEVLLCDNGSTDGSLAVARRYSDRLPLRIVDASQRRGPGSARNAGARVAAGERLVFCDADDEVAPGWLAAMARALQVHPFVAGRVDAGRLNGSRVVRSRSLDQTQDLQRWAGPVDLPHAGAGNMGIHRQLFQALGGFDPDLTCLEDTDLSWRAQLAGVDLVYAPDAVVHVRLRSTPWRMYRQGRDYGAAHARLERRYGAPARPGGGRRRAARLLRRLPAWIAGAPSPGQVPWQLGWHVGHHREAGRRVAGPTGTATSAPRTLTASGPDTR